MENNQPDFMKNRPGVQNVNRIKDVFGSQKRSTRITLTAALTVIDLVILIIGLINRNLFLIMIFAPVLIFLLLSIILGIRADRQNTPPEPTEHPDTIFKDHDE